MDPEFDQVQEDLAHLGAQARSTFVAEMLEEMTPAELARVASLSGPAARRLVVESFADGRTASRRPFGSAAVWVLAGLAVVALGCAAAAVLRGEESAAFFTFAGVALGGLTAVLLQGPQQR